MDEPDEPQQNLQVSFRDGDCGSPLGQVIYGHHKYRSTGAHGNPFRVYGHWALMLVRHGGGKYHDALGNRSDVSAGDIILITPDLAHQYGPAPGGRWDEIWISFQGAAFDLARQSGLLNPPFPVAHVRDVEAWVDRLVTALSGDAAVTAAEAAERVVRFMPLLAELLAESRPVVDSIRPESWLLRSKAILEVEMQNQVRMAEVAADVQMPESVFRQRFGQETGMSPARYRNTARMRMAQDLILGTELPIKQIATLTGFSNEFNFSRAYFHWYGRRPSIDRRSARIDSGVAPLADPHAAGDNATEPA